MEAYLRLRKFNLCNAQWWLILELWRLTSVIQAQYEATDSQPRVMYKAHPESWRPWRLILEPRKLTLTMKAHPGASEVHPVAMKAHPGASEAHPEAMKAYLGVSESHPGALEARPGVVEAHPGAVEAHPGSHGGSELEHWILMLDLSYQPRGSLWSKNNSSIRPQSSKNSFNMWRKLIFSFYDSGFFSQSRNELSGGNFGSTGTWMQAQQQEVE